MGCEKSRQAAIYRNFCNASPPAPETMLGGFYGCVYGKMQQLNGAAALDGQDLSGGQIEIDDGISVGTAAGH